MSNLVSQYPGNYQIKSFDHWTVMTDVAVSGANEKDWYTFDGNRGLFKFAKTGGDDFVCGEYWSEKLARDIIVGLGLRAMEVDMGTIGGRLGSMCYDFTIHSGSFEEYAFGQMRTSGDYILEEVRQFFTPEGFSDFIRLLLCDFLIGNTDRHSGNFARLETDYSLAPVYDSGSSLCCRENPTVVPDILKNHMRVAKYTSKSLKTHVVLAGNKLKTHDLLHYILEAYPTEFAQAQDYFSTFDPNRIATVLNNFSLVIDSHLLELINISLQYRRQFILNIT